MNFSFIDAVGGRAVSPTAFYLTQNLSEHATLAGDVMVAQLTNTKSLLVKFKFVLRDFACEIMSCLKQVSILVRRLLDHDLLMGLLLQKNGM